MTWTILEGDCIEQMRTLPDESVDAVVTDPPYGLSQEPNAAEVLRHWLAGDDYEHTGGGFMGQSWDSFVPGPSMWREALRVLKPGGHLVAFFGTRTYDLGTLAVRLAGFEIRDQIAWLFGSGFPKSLDVSKAIDKAAGAEREVVGTKLGRPGYSLANGPDNAILGRGIGGSGDPEREAEITAPATPEAQQWQGWGTALKPAFEPIVVARKPLIGTVAANVLEHGTGAINVDGCRVETGDDLNGGAYSGDLRQRDERADTDAEPGAVALSRLNRGVGEFEQPLGRWPANVVLDPEAGATLDAQTEGKLHGAGAARDAIREADASGMWNLSGDGQRFGDAGGASRFFYCAKTSSAERNAGLDGFDLRETRRYGDRGQGGSPQQTPQAAISDRNVHPTVKPIALMRWLCRLVTPPGGTILDPFTGSGSTGCAAVLEDFIFIGCEREAEYVAIAEARINWWSEHPEGVELGERLAAEKARAERAEAGQLDLLGEAAA